MKDQALTEMINYLEKGQLPDDEVHVKKIALQALLFTLLDGILFFVDQKDQAKGVHYCS